MKALVFENVGQSRIKDIAEPVLGPSDVLIAVSATGVCHTDLDILHGRYLGAYPVVPGHEISGTLVEVGSAVSSVSVGARVTVDPLITCGRCKACLRGRPSLCTDLKAYGATSNGGFAPFVAIDAANVHPIGDLPFHVAALAEPFACVMHGIDRARVAPGLRALIFGAGPIGLMMMMGLGARGISDITMVDLEESRRNRSVELGAANALAPAELDASKHAHLYDIVVDCTGVVAVCQKMPSYAADGATLLFFGVCPPGAAAAFAPFEIFRRELTLVGSHSLSNNISDAVSVLQKLGGRAEALVSHRLPLEAIARHMESPIKQGTMKIQFSAEA
jgi:threonine dehydrogenase-like Zn-dependent dehydrogenase